MCRSIGKRMTNREVYISCSNRETGGWIPPSGGLMRRKELEDQDLEGWLEQARRIGLLGGRSSWILWRDRLICSRSMPRAYPKLVWVRTFPNLPWIAPNPLLPRQGTKALQNGTKVPQNWSLLSPKMTKRNGKPKARYQALLAARHSIERRKLDLHACAPKPQGKWMQFQMLPASFNQTQSFSC